MPWAQAGVPRSCGSCNSPRGKQFPEVEHVVLCDSFTANSHQGLRVHTRVHTHMDSHVYTHMLTAGSSDSVGIHASHVSSLSKTGQDFCHQTSSLSTPTCEET